MTIISCAVMALLHVYCWCCLALVPRRTYRRQMINKNRSPLIARPGGWSHIQLSADNDGGASAPSTATGQKVPYAGGTGEDGKNVAYVESLLQNLMTLLDKWIMTGSAATKQAAYNLLDQISLHARDPAQMELAKRRIQRAGLPLPSPSDSQPQPKPNPLNTAENNKELGTTDTAKRRQEVEQRQSWEDSQRNAMEKPDSRRTSSVGLGPIEKASSDKVELQRQLERNVVDSTGKNDGETAPFDYLRHERDLAASTNVSEQIARAGALSAFSGENLGIGGLDDVLSQIKRRVWTPLAAPPQLLNELGIAPVRGLLLYGKPGCGKTLLARQLGQILSPLRYVAAIPL